jgi:hypothetical protein
MIPNSPSDWHPVQAPAPLLVPPPPSASATPPPAPIPHRRFSRATLGALLAVAILGGLVGFAADRWLITSGVNPTLPLVPPVAARPTVGPVAAAAPAAPQPAPAASTTDPTQQAIQQVIQQGDDEQAQALASKDPTVMQATATAAFYQQQVQVDQDLLDSGVTAIKLTKIEWGSITVNGTSATATAWETWNTAYSDGTTDQSRDRNVYTLVQDNGAWKVSADQHPDDTGGLGGAPGTGNPGTGNPGTGNPGSGTGNPGTGNPGTANPGTGSPGAGTGTANPGTGSPGAGTGTANPGTGSPGTSVGNPGTGNPGPGTGNPGAGNPGAGNPGTGNPGTSRPGTGTGNPSPGRRTQPGNPGGQDISQNWAGYTATGGGSYTSVTGTWAAPQFTPDSPAGADATWIGIGGVTGRDLIQAGTQQTVSGSGQTEYQSWVETLPQASHPVPLTVKSGDSVTLTISQQPQAADQWLVDFKNNTTGQTLQVTEHYTSSLSSAEWIEEAPSGFRGRQAPLDNFGTVAFSQASATRDGQTVDIAQAGGRAISMATRGQTLASPSPLTSDGAGFSVVRGQTSSGSSSTGQPGQGQAPRYRRGPGLNNGGGSRTGTGSAGAPTPTAPAPNAPAPTAPAPTAPAPTPTL